MPLDPASYSLSLEADRLPLSLSLSQVERQIGRKSVFQSRTGNVPRASRSVEGVPGDSEQQHQLPQTSQSLADPGSPRMRSASHDVPHGRGSSLSVRSAGALVASGGERAETGLTELFAKLRSNRRSVGSASTGGSVKSMASRASAHSAKSGGAPDETPAVGLEADEVYSKLLLVVRSLSFFLLNAVRRCELTERSSDLAESRAGTDPLRHASAARPPRLPHRFQPTNLLQPSAAR